MTSAARVTLIAVGYVVAFVVASAVVSVRIATTAQAAQSAGGMYAFGDTVLFLAVFGAIATVPSAVGLWMLRGHPAVWTTLAVLAAFGAAGSLAAITLYVAGRSAPSGSPLYIWTAWTPLWLLGAPPAALACFGTGLISPQRIPRATLVGAAVIHAVVGGVTLMFWFGGLAVR